MRLTRNEKTQYCGMVMLSKKIASWYSWIHDFHIFFVSQFNEMRVETGRVTHKDLAY